ncbi:MAG: hypothetical protein AB8C84_13390 [Oligoflexales bacterium]
MIQKKTIFIKKKKIAGALALSLSTWGCFKSGDDDSSTSASTTTTTTTTASTNSLALSSTINFLGADQSATALALTSKEECSALSTQYDIDKCEAGVYIYDEAMSAVSMAEKLSCFFGQTSFIEKVGAGDYIAQVSMDDCFNKGQKSSEGQSSGGAEALTLLTTNSSRADENSPLIVKFWFDMSAGGPDEGGMVRMTAKLEIEEGVSKTNPFGIWHLDWKGVQLNTATTPPTPTTTLMMQGFASFEDTDTENIMAYALYDANVQNGEVVGGKRGSGLITLSDTDSDGTFDINEATYHTQATGFEIEGSEDGGDTTIEYTLTTNRSNILRRKVGSTTDVCLDKKSFNSSVWSYGLYNIADGKRVARNSGFPIKIPVGTDFEFGWAGYHGVWAPDNISMTNGMTVYKQDFGSEETGEAHTLIQAPGKLVKHKKKNLLLTELKGVDLITYTTAGQIRVEHNGTEFKQTGTWSDESNTWTATDAAYTLQAYNNEFHSESLGGPVTIITDAALAVSEIVYFEETLASASETANTTLYCLMDCLKSGMTQNQVNGTNSETFRLTDATSVSAPHSYTWDATTLTLKYADAAVTLADGVSSISGQNSWGMSSGPLVKSTSGLVNTWDIWSASEFYTWETGPNNWNKYSALKKADGTVVTFDSPLFLEYTHANTTSSFNGQKFLLEYGGHGELQGIPWENQGNNRWGQAFSIPDGSIVGSSSEYKILGLEKELRPKAVADSACSALSLDTAPDLPEIDEWIDPDLGAKPSVTKAPAVIKGVVQS